jgi:hypothetical protein
MFEPFGQRRLEQFAAQLVAGQPEGLEHRQHLGRIVEDFGSGAPGQCRAQRTVEEPPGGDISFADAKRILGGSICLMGNIQESLFELHTPEEVAAEVRRVREIGAAGGRFVQGTQIIGSGPFRFVANEYRPGHRVIYERFDGYRPRAEPPSGFAGGRRSLSFSMSNSCSTLARPARPIAGHDAGVSIKRQR